MRRTAISALILGAVAGLAATPAAWAEESESAGQRLYQLRTYYTAPGKLDVLITRFREHNLPLFERHGITLVGAWTPPGKDEEDRLVYLVSFPGRSAADRAWKGFGNDPEWKDVFGKEKKDHGEVVTRGETVYLAPTDYSPNPGPKPARGGRRAFELRTYTASPGKLNDLNKRFREHTMELIKKHGMTNVLYTTPTEKEKGAGKDLVYLLAYPGREAADLSWRAFRDDPEWQRVSKESQPDGVPLAAKVVSAYLEPTDFSPLR